MRSSGKNAEARLAAAWSAYALVQEIRRQEEDRRAWAAGGRDREGHVDVIFHAIGFGDAAHPFGAGLKQAEVVELLEGVAVGGGAVDVLHQGHDGNGGLDRFGETRHEQGGRRAVLRGNHGDLPGDAREAVGHGRSGVLRAVGELPDAQVFGGQKNGGGKALRKNRLDAVAQ